MFYLFLVKIEVLNLSFILNLLLYWILMNVCRRMIFNSFYSKNYETYLISMMKSNHENAGDKHYIKTLISNYFFVRNMNDYENYSYLSSEK